MSQLWVSGGGIFALLSIGAFRFFDWEFTSVSDLLLPVFIAISMITGVVMIIQDFQSRSS